MSNQLSFERNLLNPYDSVGCLYLVLGVNKWKKNRALTAEDSLFNLRSGLYS